MTFKTNNGSVLVFSLLVLSIVLFSALSITAVTVSNRKSASSTSQSVQSFQVADSGAEKVLKEIYRGSYATLDALQAAIPSSTACSGGRFSFPVSGGTSTVVFLDLNDIAIGCGVATWRTDVTKIKVEGVSAGTTRVIETAIAPPACDAPTMSDNEGNAYATIAIGNQCWMAENLMTSKYPDGSDIARGAPAGGWDGSDNGYYAYPPNVGDTAEESLANIRADKLGFVYQWSAAMNGSTTEGDQGVCPSNWHVPTHDEYTILERSLCTSSSCATDFPFDTITAGWRGTNEGSKLSLYTLGGNNSSEFSGILAGYRGTSGSFYGRSSGAYLWSSTPNGGDIWVRGLNSGYTTVSRNDGNKAGGFSVRCLKD